MPNDDEPAYIVIRFRVLKRIAPWNVRLRFLLKYAIKICGFKNDGVEFIKEKTQGRE